MLKRQWRLWRTADLLAIYVFASLAAMAHPVAAQEPASTGTIHGVVVDARDGTGLQKVSVRLQDTGQTTLTGEDGRFEMTGVSAGTHELYISAVNFILVKRTITVTAGSVLDLTIPIAEGTGTYTETVTVQGAATQDPTAVGAAQQTLRSNDLLQLRGLITNDPFRGIQVLPGVASADDLRSEFTVRGVSIDHMNFTFEGVSTPLLVHTVQGVHDSGSVAMVNGDVLDEISLSSGSYPQRYGNRTGAELDFRMREGSRDGVRGHVGISMTDASFVAEGPIGRARRGSWLASVRKSYLEWVLRRLDPENDFGFGFTDLQWKVVYDLTAQHQLQFAMTAGRSRLDQRADRIGIDDVKDGTNVTKVGVLTWRYLPSPRFLLTQKVAASGNTFRNINFNGLELSHATTWDLLYRTDWSLEQSPRLTWQGGGEVRRSAASSFAQGLGFFSPRFELRENFDDDAIASSAYATARIAVGRGTFVPGARMDHGTLTGHTTVSPWVNSHWPLTASGSVSVRAGGGVYQQEPGFAEVRGLRGRPGLRTERAYQADAGLEGRWGKSGIWQTSVYDREDRGLLRLPESELRTVNGTLVLPSFMSRYQNALDGHSRGAELLIQRRSPNGLSGWIAYDLSFTKYRDRNTGETFWGDFDQRHTLNMYATYRLSDRMSVGARFRAGSNFPTPGYWEPRGDLFFLSEQRNALRVPTYSRLDARANRTFTWKQKRLTLFVEALNLYGRDNVRPASAGINGRTFQAFGLFDTMFPFIPSAGFLLEF